MPTTKKTVSLREIRVGLMVLVSIAVLVFLILNASGDINPFARKLHLKALFADANGLREGSEVRLAGVRVGKVEKITLLAPSNVPNAPRVEATMTIDNVARAVSYMASLSLDANVLFLTVMATRMPFAGRG